MPTLYVENIPEDLYAALRKRARERRTSIAAEVLEMLQRNVPTPKELARRRNALNRALQLSKRPPARPDVYPTAEEMIAEDRAR
jgi:plasmid stability protein